MKDYFYFKYRDINKYSLDSLIKGSLYFASPDKLNDPFDCRLDIKKSILHAASKLKGEQASKIIALSKDENLYESIKEDFSRIGVCSFSLDSKNVVMWSHYANNHKGITILYDFPEIYLNDKNKFIGITEVSYEEDPLTNWFVHIASKSKMILKDYIFELARLLLTSKDPGWAYENEVRIIRPTPGNFEIKKEFIKQICFGLHTPKEDIKLIKEIVSYYSHNVTLCKVVRTENDFGIDIEET